MKYKVAYIDESDARLNTFYQTFKEDFEIYKIKVDEISTVDSITQEIIDNELDGAITDYLLEEEGNVDFNGDKVVAAIKATNPHFPITMLTSYEPQAIQNMDDVHIINGKDILDGEHEEKLEILKSKIISNIDRYYSKISTTTKKIETLVKKRNESSLDINEEEELTKLYMLMDELDPEGKELPANLIQGEAITKLNDFVNQTRNILEELKKQ